MKKITIFTAVLVLSLGVLMADFPGFKFVAPMEGVSGPAEGPWTLTVMATSSQTIDLILDEYSEIEKKHGGPLTPEGLAALPAGTILKIRANFTEAGFYASEVEVFKDERDFELRGELESVDCGLGIITMFGYDINLDDETEITNADGDLLGCGDLAVGQFADLRGKIYDSEFWASEIKVGVPGEEHLLMEFDAVVLEMADSAWLVEIRGGKEKTPVPVLVVLDENTQIEGVVDVGTEVEVNGILTPEMAVLAKKIIAEDAEADDDEGEQEQEGQERELEVYWAPGEIRSAPQGARTVKLMLKHGVAPEDLVIPLTTDLSPELEIEVDSEVTMPQGERVVDVQIVFLTLEGEGTITATLAEGDSDELEIELKPNKNKNGDDDDDDEEEEEEDEE